MAETIAPTPEVAKHPRPKSNPDAAEPAGGAKPVAPTPKEVKADPEGVAPANKAAQDEPKGLPNSDRHKMETAVANQS